MISSLPIFFQDLFTIKKEGVADSQFATPSILAFLLDKAYSCKNVFLISVHLLDNAHRFP
jgi:hypothetical protein